MVYTGLTPGRGDDQIGLSFASANFSDRYSRSQAFAGETTDNREVVVEAVYNAAIASWLSVQPDLQHVVNPGGEIRSWTMHWSSASGSKSAGDLSRSAPSVTAASFARN